MGKKAKKKARNAQKEKRPAHRSQEPAAADADAPSRGGGCSCGGVDRSAGYDKLAARLRGAAKCGECRPDSRSKAEGGTGDPRPKALWVCLQCGHLGCAAAANAAPKGHALLHSRRARHPVVFRLDNPVSCWCFSCDSAAPVGSDHVLARLQELLEGSNGGGVGDEKAEAGRSSDGKGYTVRGLPNVGNTCFFNSVLQNLFAIGDLRDYFANLDRPMGPITMSLKKLFDITSMVVDEDLNPKHLLSSIRSKAPQFEGYQQQDSHELLRCLLDGLNSEEVDERTGSDSVEDEACKVAPPTFVESVFGGQLSSTVCCSACGSSSKVYEQFLDLSLPIPAKGRPAKRFQASPPKKAKLRKKEGFRGGGRSREKRKSDVVTPVVSKSTAEDVGDPSSTGASCLDSDSVAEPAGELQDADDAWMDYLGTPEPSEDHGGSDPENAASSVDQGVDEKKQPSDGTDAIESPKISCSGNELPGGEAELKTGEAENPLHVRESEVFGPANKEGVLSTEANDDLRGSTYKHKENEESFEGIGDLFDEPEVISGVKASHETNGNTQCAPLCGNNSESNEDEVDREISLDSCLALFSQPELLSNGQGWYCENCPKILKQQRIEELDGKDCTDSLQMNVNSRPDKYSAITVSDEVCDSDVIGRRAESEMRVTRSQSRKAKQSGFAAISDLDQVEDHLHSKPTQLRPPQNEADDYDDSQTLRVSNKVVKASRANPQLAGQVCRMKDIEDKGVESCDVKVKRDATKQMLISKAPPVLTVHLKRFFQNAHGHLRKINGHVTFSEILDLGPSLDKR